MAKHGRDKIRGLIKPGNAAIKKYYAELKTFSDFGIGHELAVRSAFQHLLETTGKRHGWHLVLEVGIKKPGGGRAVPDGTMKNEFNMDLGWWEAKDADDDLDREIRKKIAGDYPTGNIIFENTQTAALYQNGNEVLRADIREPKQLAELLNTFYAYIEPDIASFEKAVVEFKDKVPDLAEGLVKRIKEAHEKNKHFQTAFEHFFDLCRSSLNPNIRIEAVDEMIVQHLLTERLFRRIFNDPDFTRRNVIANEVENVIGALVKDSGNRHEFLAPLNKFYVAIEDAASNITDFSEKQHFLNIVYESFFQGYSVKVADRLGIVYTPQPIVNFMCESVKEVLEKDFGLTLGSKGVNILDPCTGTGNFIVNLMSRISKKDLPRVYSEQLFANEVMLLPYYIAAMNIEHEYRSITGGYEPFDGLSFVDTLDMMDKEQGEFSFMTQVNTERVERQKETPITVIIGNPPYNVGQLDENDNNKNRVYKAVEKEIRDTYAKDSKATNKNALSDAYVKFFRWATDRLNGRDGIVCFVSNNSFVHQIAFDGMRKHLLKDFQKIYHVDLHGNVRQNPKISGTSHNVFGIQVGVGITVAIRKKGIKQSGLNYVRVEEDWRKEDKYKWLIDAKSISGVKWRKLKPDKRNFWIVPEHAGEFEKYTGIGSKDEKGSATKDSKCLFNLYSSGLKTNRDQVVYDFNKGSLSKRVEKFIEDYNSEVDRLLRLKKKDSRKAPKKEINIDEFVKYENIKWSETLKKHLLRGTDIEYDDANIRISIYRPYAKYYLYYDPILNERRYQFPRIFPTTETEEENRVICLTGIGIAKQFSCLATSILPEVQVLGNTQCFPYYAYDEDGTNRKENITDWARDEFRKHYKNNRISKWDIFYYVYGILHHPGYRTKFADNLKRDLPRIPYAPDFSAFSKAGKQLAKWHVEYEDAESHELDWVESEDTPLSYLVKDKMRLSKDKIEIKYNDSLTLRGIPPEVYEYRLGNRSALEWVIDQYQVKTFKRSGIKSDPNRPDDPQYIIRLLGQVIKVSLDTVKIVNNLPSEFA